MEDIIIEKSNRNSTVSLIETKLSEYNCVVENSREWYADTIIGLIKKVRELVANQVKDNSLEFAEWLYKNQYHKDIRNGRWCKFGGLDKSFNLSDIYQIFKDNQPL